MRSSGYNKNNIIVVRTTLKPFLIIVFAMYLTNCSFFQSQQDRTYRLTNKTFESDRSLAFSPGEREQLRSVALIASNDELNQSWQITPEGDDYYRIKNRAIIDRSFEVFDGEKDNRTRMADSADDEGQLWEIVPVENDYYRLSNKWRGADRSLVTKKEEQYEISLTEPNNGDEMLWKRISAGGDYFRFVNKLYGDKLTLFPFKEGELGFEDEKDLTFTYQHWRMEPLGNNFFRIVNRLDVDEKRNRSIDNIPTQQNSSEIKMNDSTDADSQKWKMETVNGDYFRLVNANGMALQVKLISNHYLMMVDSDDNDPEQLWKIIRTN